MKTKRQPTEAAIVSKTIKKLLATNYPNVKFSVTSDNFSGGDEVRISWSFGPTTDEVENITSRFKGGYFDGMNDIYEYHQDAFEVDEKGNIVKQPTVKYISTSRYFANADEKNVYQAKSRIVATSLLCEAFGIENKETANLYPNSNDYNDQAGNVAARLLRVISYPSDQIEIVACVRTAKDCGSIEDIYTFTFNDLKQPAKAKEVKKVEAVKAKEVAPEAKPVEQKQSFIKKLLAIFTF